MVGVGRPGGGRTRLIPTAAAIEAYATAAMGAAIGIPVAAATGARRSIAAGVVVVATSVGASAVAAAATAGRAPARSGRGGGEVAAVEAGVLELARGSDEVARDDGVRGGESEGGEEGAATEERDGELVGEDLAHGRRGVEEDVRRPRGLGPAGVPAAHAMHMPYT